MDHCAPVLLSFIGSKSIQLLLVAVRLHQREATRFLRSAEQRSPLKRAKE